MYSTCIKIYIILENSLGFPLNVAIGLNFAMHFFIGDDVFISSGELVDVSIEVLSRE